MPKNINQFFKFAIVGFTGTILHMLVLYTLTEFIGVYYLTSAIIAFTFAATSNFIFNKIWTFNERFRSNTTKKYLKFFAVSICALLVNLFFLYTLTEFLHIYYLISQLMAIAFSLWINFLGNKYWTFKKSDYSFYYTNKYKCD